MIITEALPGLIVVGLMAYLITRALDAAWLVIKPRFGSVLDRWFEEV